MISIEQQRQIDLVCDLFNQDDPQTVFKKPYLDTHTLKDEIIKMGFRYYNESELNIEEIIGSIESAKLTLHTLHMDMVAAVHQEAEEEEEDSYIFDENHGDTGI